MGFRIKNGRLYFSHKVKRGIVSEKKVAKEVKHSIRRALR